MTYAVDIIRNTRRPATELAAYRVGISQTDAPATQQLEPGGAVVNGFTRYLGTYATLADACRAVCEYVDAPHTIAQQDYGDGDIVYALRGVERVSGFDGICHTRVIARRDRHGIWISKQTEAG